MEEENSSHHWSKVVRVGVWKEIQVCEITETAYITVSCFICNEWHLCEWRNRKNEKFEQINDVCVSVVTTWTEHIVMGSEERAAGFRMLYRWSIENV